MGVLNSTEKKESECIIALTTSKIRDIRNVQGFISRQSSHELMMTLGFFPQMSDMTDKQPSRDMQKKECDKLRLKREILSG